MKMTDLLFGAGVISLLVVCVSLTALLIETLLRGLYFLMSHPGQALAITAVIMLAIYAVGRFVSK